MISSIIDTEVDEAVGLLARDLLTTLGSSQEHAVRRSAGNIRWLFDHNTALNEDGEPDQRDWDFAYFMERLVEDVQQWLHDTFVDTTWPTCPRHGRHPLWLIDGSWKCDADDVVVARLGELRNDTSG